jgi:hypothetical protein
MLLCNVRLVELAPWRPMLRGVTTRLQQEASYNSQGQMLHVRDVAFRKALKQAEIPTSVAWSASQVPSDNYFRVCELSQ